VITPEFIVAKSMIAMIVIPTFLLGALAIPCALRVPWKDARLQRITSLSFAAAMIAAIVGLGTYVLCQMSPQILSFGSWFSFGSQRFALDFVADGFSLGFALLSIGICGVTSAFSFRYLLHEPGFHRYFVQLAMFVLGMVLVSLAGSIEVLYAGWEMLGLSSALLVGFFHERRSTVNNALRVFAVYRVSDAAMLSAAVLLHHWAQDGSLTSLFSASGAEALGLAQGQAVLIAVLLIVAVAGKSSLLPFSGWLPRAMEGPTPSSAVYYGALSVHAGCYLLLRAEPLLAQSAIAQGLAAFAGVATALYATLLYRVQTDIKSALSYASLTQVSIIVVEISLGLTTVAFVHIIGHACFRLLQFLSSPNILHDLHQLENRLDNHSHSAPSTPGHLGPADATPSSKHPGWYLIALERGFVDSLLDRLIVNPFLRIVALMDRFDRAMCGSKRTADSNAFDRPRKETSL